MSAADQAAGLRRWAEQAKGPAPATPQAAPATLTTLVVVGLPGTSPRQARRVTDLLAHWADQGRRWVGDPAAWKVVPLDVASPHLALLADQQQRWALWVEGDAEAFRRAFGVLRRLAAARGPRRLLAVHPPGLARRGLLDNLQQAARAYLDIELLVMAP
ncbi:hypothetical protein [Halomonas nitroreducens]|uniref:DUF2868 domain-containing protein n=1 Tax=Halomonas nitroreducens TaxID=447425 RepID=A0A431V5X8_9GAMM|nr:hypothetical protein [Halomonas nitroreducens]RTR04441.1 hypothetical protein EKG36_08985 [Halomonas nitroreducens]